MGKWFGTDGGWNLEHRWFNMMCQIFVLLTCCTAFDVFHDLGSGARPEIFPVDALNGFVLSGVPIDRSFTPHVHQLAFQPLIWWDDEALSFDIPLEWFIRVVYTFNWVYSFSFSH
jgi:hypothetical protein